VDEIRAREAVMPTAFSSSDIPAGDAPRIARLGDLLAEWQADAEAATRARVEQRPRGPVSGLTMLDRELGGAFCPGLHVVHGSPGVGKTAFALQIAASCGAPALYVSTEMRALELLRRHVARVTGTFLGRLKSGELPAADSLALARRAAAAAPQLAIADATRAPAVPAWIADAAEATRGNAEHLLIVVDSGHSWAYALAEGAPEYDALNAGLDALGRVAAQLGCAVLVIAERNRAAMASGGLHAAAGSRKFEYQAESVLDLARRKDAEPNAAGEVAITLTIEKNRNGSPGRVVPLTFCGPLQRYTEA